jgi:hypothetical protein
MCYPMSFNLIKFNSNLNLETLTINSKLFGYFQAECYIPKSNRPLLPFKHEGKTIYPYGSWCGADVYFFKEMKALIPSGYKFKLISGYEFSRKYLFNKYVKHFYNI